MILGGIIPENQVQQNLFVESSYDKMKNINNLLDSVNHRFGRNKLHLAVQGSTVISGGATEKWQMRREHLSKNYTTNLNEIITLKA